MKRYSKGFLNLLAKHKGNPLALCNLFLKNPGPVQYLAEKGIETLEDAAKAPDSIIINTRLVGIKFMEEIEEAKKKHLVYVNGEPVKKDALTTALQESSQQLFKTLDEVFIPNKIQKFTQLVYNLTESDLTNEELEEVFKLARFIRSQGK